MACHYYIRLLITEHTTSNVFTKADKYDPCRQYVLEEGLNFKCQPEFFNTNETQKCTKFVYDQSQMKETLTTKFNLVCDQDHKRRLLSTFLMLGIMLFYIKIYYK